MGRAKWSVGPPSWTSKISLDSCLGTSFFFSFLFSMLGHHLGLRKNFQILKFQSLQQLWDPLWTCNTWFGFSSFFLCFSFLFGLCYTFLSNSNSNLNFRFSTELERNLENLKQLGWAHHGSPFLGFMPKSVINSFAEILIFWPFH